MNDQTLTFRVGTKHGKKRTVKWRITHNLAEFGLSLEAAFDAWCARADDPEKLGDFIDYVKSKDPVNIRCYGKEE